MSEQRQATRDRYGRYKNMAACPRCGERHVLEPAYPKEAGGPVRDDSKWAWGFLCSHCIRIESEPTPPKELSNG